ncbi:type VII secretion protein EccB [Kitasatospora sp. GAS204B]|uniref:type VII secretion protein EccB n=1 Tax=unclassified Kitasatospora TaxID=2633591 RepID=UPI0024733C1C|nr:type VII secretion protein EccB [Kitasatospora sp. GAS204B]MDH6122446.1 type VII secretion protein EccB [Kitasatospora sp. GAS204B]
MASRRDELNAYTFARKRTVGAFLQPVGGGSDEDAPRPIRAVVPSLVVAAVLVAGFGAWGLIKPTAPQGWADGSNVILGKDSTTRYVVLTSADGTKMLHPVLNMASAKLVLPVNSKVVIVADSAIDNYASHGPTIGIPYAPDKLPSATDAGTAKKWSVCDRPGSDADHPNQAVFVTAGADAATLARPDRKLGDGQSLWVQGLQKNGVPGPQFLVDPQGRAHPIGTSGMSDNDLTALRIALFGNGAQPEHVSDDWLATLAPGSPIGFPQVPGMSAGAPTPSDVQLSDQSQRYVGRLVTSDGTDYVVGKSQLYKVTPFQAELLRQAPITANAYKQGNQQGNPGYSEITPADNAKYYNTVTPLANDADWPTAKPGASVNAGGPGPSPAHQVVCSTFEGLSGSGIAQSVWAGTDYPAAFTPGAASAYVSPGHGLFYRAMDNTADGSGSDYLITETGLRYSVPASSEGTVAGASPTPTAAASASPAPAQQQVNQAQDRLGYQNTTPVLVPKAWSNLIPAGPELNTNAATQVQNS